MAVLVTQHAGQAEESVSSRSLDDLDSRFRPLAEQVIESCKTAMIDVTIITTLRTVEEQVQAVKHGVSWTMNSKHLPQPPEGKSLAIDLVPTHLINTKNWSPTHPDWWVIAKAGVALGLRSGMDWHNVGLPPVGVSRPSFDPGHLEYVLPAP